MHEVPHCMPRSVPAFVLNNVSWSSAPIRMHSLFCACPRLPNVSLEERPGSTQPALLTSILAALTSGHHEQGYGDHHPPWMSLFLSHPPLRAKTQADGRGSTPEVQPWEKTSCLSSDIIRPIRQGLDLLPCFLLSEMNTVS